MPNAFAEEMNGSVCGFAQIKPEQLVDGECQRQALLRRVEVEFLVQPLRSAVGMDATHPCSKHTIATVTQAVDLSRSLALGSAGLIRTSALTLRRERVSP